MAKKKTASEASRENAQRHWDLIRRLAKETKLTTSQVHGAWSAKIRPWLDEILEKHGHDYREKKLTPVRKSELRDLILPEPWLANLVLEEPAKVTSSEPLLVVGSDPLEHTVKVKVKGDPGQLINVLLCMTSVTNVSIDKG